MCIDCQEKLKSSLFMVGLIGLNDITRALGGNYSIDQVKEIVVPLVVQTIKDGVQVSLACN